MNAIQSVKHKRSHKPLMNAFHDRKPRPKKNEVASYIHLLKFQPQWKRVPYMIHGCFLFTCESLSMRWNLFSLGKRGKEMTEREGIAGLFSSVLGSFHFDIAFTAQHMEMWCALIAQDTRSWESIFNCWIKKQLHVSLSKKKEVPCIWIWRFMK